MRKSFAAVGSSLFFAAAPAVVAGVIPFLYAVFVGLAFYGFVRVYEEPTLRRRYGEEYEAYRRAVPGWIPRVRPWDP